MPLKERVEQSVYATILSAVGLEDKQDEAQLAELIESVGPHWWDHVIEAAKLQKDAQAAGLPPEQVKKLIEHLYGNPPGAPSGADGKTTLDQEGWWVSGYRQALINMAKALGFNVQVNESAEGDRSGNDG